MKLSKEDLKKIIGSMPRTNFTRFNNCQAWVSLPSYYGCYNKTFQLIKSYTTIVAVIDCTDNILYELGKYSKTTSKQIIQINNQMFGAERVLVKDWEED